MVPLACEQPATTGGAATHRDSAGVRIVESSAPRWRPDETWRLSLDQRVVIGAEEADPPYQFTGIRGGTRLPNGNLVILDGGSAELRFYDAKGRHLRSVGRKGGGPGEFARPMHVQQAAGGQLVVWDYGLGPVTNFDSGGAYLGRTHIDRAAVMNALGVGLAVEAVTPLRDGTFILHVIPRTTPENPLPVDRLFRPPRGFYRVDPRVGRADSLSWYSGLPQIFMNRGGRRIGTVALFPTAANVAAGSRPMRMYAGDGATFSIDVFDGSGRRVRIIRRTDEPRRIPQREVRARRNERLRLMEARGRRADVEYLLDALPTPETYPAFRSMHVDLEGFLWVRTFIDGWAVFDTDGVWLGNVELDDLSPLEIGRNYVLGVARDALDVERVVLVPLDRRGAGE
jgi:hypothetical protein